MKMNGIATVRMENVFVIASEYGVSTLINVGSDGLRKNGKFTVHYDGQSDYVCVTGKSGTIFRGK